MQQYPGNIPVMASGNNPHCTAMTTSQPFVGLHALHFDQANPTDKPMCVLRNR